MMPACAPDPSLGIAMRLSQYVGCEARTLGENGFQAFAGGPFGIGLLSGLVTIFIALVGYRFILGAAGPNIRDGIGWAARLGLVLALVTSWPAFQILVFRVVTDGPTEIASAVLPAAGLGFGDLDARVQQAYDTIRLGTFDMASPAANSSSPASDEASAAQPFKFQTPLPNTASLLVISTVGVLAALQIAIGFLLAIAPLPLMSLLFEGTSALFSGWLRALAAAALMTVGATVVTSIDLVMIESELAHLETYRTAAVPPIVDPQALSTIIFLFAVVMLIALVLSSRVASSLKAPERLLRGAFDVEPLARAVASPSVLPNRAEAGHPSSQATIHEQSRVTSISDALARAGERERILLTTNQPANPSAGESRFGANRDSDGPALVPAYVLTKRRRLPRRTHSAIRRDRKT